MSTASLAFSRPLPRIAPAHRVGQAEHSMRRVYVVRRVSVAAASVVVGIVLTTLLSTRLADASAPTGANVVAGPFVVAQPGDTLWSLAREVQPSGDVRPLVAQLARAHGGSALRAGDRIALPRPLAEQVSRAIVAVE